MPHLNDLHQRHASRGLKIVAVSREKGDVIAQFIREESVVYPVARSSRASGLYGVSGIPDAFIISKEGRILWRGHPGYIDDAMLNAWLGGQPLPPGAAPSRGETSAISMFWKLGVAILLCGLAVFLVLRKLGARPAAPAYPMYPMHAGPPVQQPQQPQQPPPAQSASCAHCGAPKREGRKTCMSCGAPL